MDLTSLPTWAPPVHASPEVTHQVAIAQGARCSECSLYGCRRGPVFGEVRKGASLVVIGEAPSPREVEEGHVFIGQSGVELDMSLEMGGLARSQCTITNTLLCQPPEDLSAYLRRLNAGYQRARERAKELGEPLPHKPLTPMDCCAPRLAHEIKESGAKTILAVGGKALQAVAGIFDVPFAKGKDAVGVVKISTIKKQHGSPVVLDNGTIICSSLHPAFAMRGARAYRDVIREDIARAARIVVRGNKIDWHEPRYILFPDLPTIEATCRKFIDAKAKVTIDIESDSAVTQTCKVRCVGLGATINGEEIVIVVPFRYMSGTAYWGSDEDKLRAAAAVREVADTCELVMHNGAFDTAVMLRVGLMTDRGKTLHDTMVMHHNTDHNDLPHDLGFVSTRFLEVPKWKDDVDHKAANNVERDNDLHLYNARDIITTMRTEQHLQQRILACGTAEQHATDTALIPVARDMGDMGLFIDENVRGALSKDFNQRCFDLRRNFQEITGVPDINPRSFHQLRKWFFKTKGYTPILNPQGYEWEEDDDPSTSSAALLRMLAMGVDKQTETAIDTLMEFRAYDKLRGTYVDNLHVRDVDWENDYGIPLSAIGRAPAVYAPGGDIVIPERLGMSLLNTVYKIHVVPSGRWSAAPACQNWPALGKSNMRKMVVAPPGHVIVGADYAQVEARIYAIMAKDKLLLDAFARGLDAHSMNAASLFAENESKIPAMYEYVEHNPDKKIRKHMRTIAKRFAFLEIYGGEEEKLYSVMSADRDKGTGRRTFPDLKPADVTTWHRRWHKFHPETARWHHMTKSAQREHGYVATLIDHRKRFFPGGPDKANAVPNHTIQGSAAAIMNRAILKVAKEIPYRAWSPVSGLFLQVHDNIAVYCPEDRAEEAKEIIERCMYTEIEGMPFPAKADISRCWADQD